MLSYYLIELKFWITIESIPSENTIPVDIQYNAGRQRLPSPAAPSKLVAALFRLLFCFEYLSKSSGPPVLNMELQINMWLMDLAAQTKTRFLSHMTKHFYSSWFLALCISCLLMLIISWKYNPVTSTALFFKMKHLTTSVQFSSCQFPFILLDYLWSAVAQRGLNREGCSFYIVLPVTKLFAKHI